MEKSILIETGYPSLLHACSRDEFLMSLRRSLLQLLWGTSLSHTCVMLFTFHNYGMDTRSPVNKTRHSLMIKNGCVELGCDL